MGTHRKAVHRAAGISPATDPLGAVLKHAIATLPKNQPKTFSDQLNSEWTPADDTGQGQATAPAQPGNPAASSDTGTAEALTPVPDTLPEGSPAGIPVLAGGEDLLDSTVTLLSYSAPGGPREMLFATVTEAAEAKLIEALGVSDQKMIPVQVQQEVTGRLPLDEQQQLHEQVSKAAKSVNHKLKQAIEIPEQTIGYYQTAKSAVHAVLDDPASTADEKAMAAHYAAQLNTIADRIRGAPPYDEGGKIPVTQPYLHTGMATVTKYVPAPVDDPESGQLPAVLRTASRIKASIDPASGIATWDGTARADAHGKEYAIDLGDGWSAVYRPHAANDPAHDEYSIRGQLEVHAPQGAGHGPELVRRLGQLNLVNRPLTAAEGEWTYLNANITAQGLDKHKGVTVVVTATQAMEELQLQEIFHERQHDLAGLSESALQTLARDWQLEAAARCLPKKVAMVRDAVAAATGHADGLALAASPGYDPVPRRSGGWLTWSRFDVTGSTPKLQQAWSGKCLEHRVSGGNLLDVLATGVLASSERRAVMGVSAGLGMSESSDKFSGGASSVFLRVRKHSSLGPSLIWDDPTVLMSRADYYGFNGDHFGSVNPASSHKTSGMTRDAFKIAAFSSDSNEVMLRNGIDLLGAEAPSTILCGSPAQRTKILDLFKTRGITQLRGKPVSEVVQ
jgi:hypothetical protein